MIGSLRRDHGEEQRVGHILNIYIEYIKEESSATDIVLLKHRKNIWRAGYQTCDF